ncbi:MAG TPA: hypothetical protein VN783_11145 [Thermoanaerobaculia bacterium]|nr:hypothetical protein [Thermoanaerobaculia bacterium]
MAKIIGPLTWAWVIIIGILMILPDGVVVCLACGLVFNKVLGVISIALGVAGFVTSRART